MIVWCVMKVGDLVNFFSSFDAFSKEYVSRNPGVVLWVGKSGVRRIRKSAMIMWSDGSETTEHLGYLTKVTKNV